MKYKVEVKLGLVKEIDDYYILDLSMDMIHEFIKSYLKSVNNTINITIPYSELGLSIPCTIVDIIEEDDKFYLIVDSVRNLTEYRNILFGSLNLDISNNNDLINNRTPLEVTGINTLMLLDVTDAKSISDNKLSKVISIEE